MKFSINSFSQKKKNKKKNEKKKWNEIKIQEEVGGQDFHVKVLAIHQYFTINNRCPRQCDEHLKIASATSWPPLTHYFKTLIDGKSFNLKTSLCLKSYNRCCIPVTLNIKPCVMLKYEATL